MRFRDNRSRLVGLLLGVFLGAVVAGCAPGVDPPDADARKLATPVTVQHRFGSTTIKTVPKRIVTIDVQWTDTMLAMGVKPVGYSVDDLMPDAGVPWQRQKLPAGAEAFSVTDGVPVERILALDPDLVVGSFSIDNDSTYRLLANRVPTIAGPPAADQVTPWQELVRTAGKILDAPDKAKQVISSTEQAVAAEARQLPGLRNKTFSLAQYVVGDSMYIVADDADGSSIFFQRLGMRLYPPVRTAGERAGQTRVSVSTERADLLRADLLAFLINGGNESALADIPGFRKLPGTVAVLDYPTVVGLNTPTPLSIPYALDELRPYLRKAAQS